MRAAIEADRSTTFLSIDGEQQTRLKVDDTVCDFCIVKKSTCKNRIHGKKFSHDTSSPCPRILFIYLSRSSCQ